jgi:hypothetical protein
MLVSGDWGSYEALIGKTMGTSVRSQNGVVLSKGILISRWFLFILACGNEMPSGARASSDWLKEPL